MRWFLAAVVATLAALTVSAPTAAAAAERARCSATTSDPWTTWCWFAHPTGWERVHQGIPSCERCREAGRQGIDDGRWPRYHCEGFPQGLDFVYDLYVPPEG